MSGADSDASNPIANALAKTVVQAVGSSCRWWRWASLTLVQVLVNGLEDDDEAKGSVFTLLTPDQMELLSAAAQTCFEAEVGTREACGPHQSR